MSNDDAPSWGPLDDADLEDLIVGEWEPNYEKMALAAIKEAKCRYASHEERMEWLAEAQVYATLATSRGGLRRDSLSED